MAQRTGKCLCGAVSISADIVGGVQACHCVQCQRWTGGGPLFAIRADNLEISGGETAAESYCASTWGERVVCKSCGSTLWWKMQNRAPDFVCVGLLDDQSDLTVTEEIFVDHRPAWLPPFEGANQSTEAEQIAKFDAWMAKQKQQET